jgi:hypothetical protein
MNSSAAKTPDKGETHEFKQHRFDLKPTRQFAFAPF